MQLVEVRHSTAARSLNTGAMCTCVRKHARARSMLRFRVRLSTSTFIASSTAIY